jgi:hypothetical protein
VPTERDFAHRSGQATKVFARANDALLHTKDATLALEHTLSLLRARVRRIDDSMRAARRTLTLSEAL